MSKEFNYGNALLVGAGLVGAYLIIKNYKGGSADDSALGGSAGGSDLPLGGGLEEGLVGGSYTPQESNIPTYNPVIGTIEDPTIKAIIEQGRKESITEPSKILNNIDAINFLGMDITPIKETENTTDLKLGSDIPAYRDTVLGMGETVDLIALGIPSLLPSYGTSLGRSFMKGEIMGFEKRAIEEVPLAGKFVLNTGKQTIKATELKASEKVSKTLLKDIGKRSLKVGVSVIPFIGLSAGTAFDVYNRPVLQSEGFKNKKGNPNIGAYALAGTANLFGDVLGGAGAVAGAELEGGVIVNETPELKDREYFGYLHGTDEQCLKAIENCKDFAMKEIPEKEALAFFERLIPVNSETQDINGMDKEVKQTKFVDYARVDIDGKIKQDLKMEKVIIKE